MYVGASEAKDEETNLFLAQMVVVAFFLDDLCGQHDATIANGIETEKQKAPRRIGLTSLCCSVVLYARVEAKSE